ncbi:MAG: WD40 repeat domain-containing protein, partial [Limisphaerales bacterium]
MKLELLKEIKLPTAALGLSSLDQSTDLLVSCFDGSVLRVNPLTEQWEELGRHQSYASGVVSVLEGHLAVSAGYDGVLQWHDLSSGKTLAVEKIHDFWSWQLKASPDGRRVASVTGQYLCGGYRYEPAPEKEASVKVFDAATQSLMASFEHLPPVLSVAFSPDSRYLAAANMMGDIRIWDLSTGMLKREWNTP